MKLVKTALMESIISSSKIAPNEDQAGDEWVDHKFVIECCKLADMRLQQALQGTAVYFPPPPPARPKSEEYLKFMQELRLQAQENEYRELAGIKDETGPMFASSDAKQVKEEITTILNFAVSVVAVGFALWYWAKWWDPATRTLLSILGSLVVLLAEVVVYASYRHKVDEARQVERAKKSENVVRETYTFGKQPGPEEERLGLQLFDAASKSSAITTGRLTKRKI